MGSTWPISGGPAFTVVPVWRSLRRGPVCSNWGFSSRFAHHPSVMPEPVRRLVDPKRLRGLFSTVCASAIWRQPRMIGTTSISPTSSYQEWAFCCILLLFQSDDDFPSGVPFFQIPDRLGNLAQALKPVGHQAPRAGPPPCARARRRTFFFF